VLLASNDEIDAATTELVRARDEARAKKEWARADELRAELENQGWIVEDSSVGTVIRRG
jgi:cysteinyl-tRNA synthetase